MIDINMYDMLVFEDENGNIYQDCVCEISKNVQYGKHIKCNYTDIYFNTNGYIERITVGSNLNYKLKEIWTRVDEDTYKKTWYDGDYFYNHLAKKTFKDISLKDMLQNVHVYSDEKIFEKIHYLMSTEYDIFNIDFLNALKFCMTSKTKLIARDAVSIYNFYKEGFDEVEKNDR